MFTQYDKAIAGLLGAIAYFLTFFFGTDYGLTPDMVTKITGFLVAAWPFITYFVPNKSHV